MGTEESITPEPDKVVEDVKEELKTSSTLSMSDLEALEDRLGSHLKSLAKDKTKDDEDKAKLEGQIEALNDRLQKLIEAAEERERKHEDEATMIVPPSDLNPTHQNPPPDGAQQENPSSTQAKKERKGWKGLW